MTTIIAMLLVALLVLNALMFIRQPSMIFYPSKNLQSSPKDWGMQYEDVSLETSDGKQLHAWYMPCPGADRVVLFFHGNAGNISHRGESVAIFHRLGLNVFIIDYRGYGNSQGIPTEGGLYLDAIASWQYLTQVRSIKKANIIIFGRSLGGSVASNLAAKVHPGALILESTFSSARDMAKSVFPLLSRLLILRFSFNSLAKVNKIECPLLVLHSKEDEIIPFHMGRKIFHAANQPKFFVTMKGDHNSGFLFSQPGYEQSIREFIDMNVISHENEATQIK